MEKDSQKNYSVVRFYVTLFILGFIPNIIGAAFIILFFMFLNYTSITEDLARQYIEYNFTLDIVITASVFATFIIIAVVRVMSTYTLLSRYINGTILKDEITILKKKVLNIPSLVMRLTIMGWFMAATSIIISMHFKGMSLVNKVYFFVIIFIIAGSLAFVITYYLFDSYFRKCVPLVFPDGDFSEVEGVKVIPINVRMLIAFWIGGLLPVIMLLFFSYIYIDNIITGIGTDTMFNQFNILMIFALFQSVFMSLVSSFYFSRNIGNPLRDVQKGMKAIQFGNYDISLLVNYKDEMGDVNSGFNAMAVGLKERHLLKDAFGKFVSPTIRDEVMKGNLALGGKRMPATILFSDIRNFTTLSENLPAENVVDILNAYFNEMVRPVVQNEGVLDKYIGDAIMAVFGPPSGLENHAVKALTCALVMKEKLAVFNELRRDLGQPQITIGIGINSGDIIAGNIGSSDRMEYTVIGDAVNTASRVEQLTKTVEAGIIVTENTLQMLPEGHPFLTREIGKTQIKGKKETLHIYELTGMKS